MIDWLGITLRGMRVEDAVRQMVPGEGGDFGSWHLLEDKQGRPVGGLGYGRSAVYGPLRVYWDGNEGTVHLEASGQGVRELEALGVDDWGMHLRRLLGIGATLTRIDLALDAKGNEALDMGMAFEAVQKGNYVARASRTDTVEGVAVSRWESRRGRAAKPGRTLYVGAPSSRAKVRIYDKQAEREAKGEADPGPWTRAELELRRERAQAAALAIGGLSVATDPRDERDLGGLVASLLAGLVDFVEPSADSNRRRAKRAAWWDAFLRGALRARLGIIGAVRTLETTKAWMQRMVGPSLAAILLADGHDGFIWDTVEDGKRKMGPRHMALVRGASVVT